MRATLAIALLLLPSLALAQAPDIDGMQKAINVLTAQRNNAMNAHAEAEVRALKLAEENARLKAELEKKTKGK